MESLCKRERELKEWLEKGSNNWHEAFFMYTNRRVNHARKMKAIQAWFNRTLKGLQAKGYMKDVGYVFETDAVSGLRWVNPLIDGTKSSAIVGQEYKPALLEKRNIL